MEVKNGIIIDGVLHEAVESDNNHCDDCSLYDFCQGNYNEPLCYINTDLVLLKFVNRGKVTNIEIEETK